MRMHIWIAALLTSIIQIAPSSAQPYPDDFFEAPVQRDIFLSGTFGELRPGHFHAGIDIKSIDGRSGEKVHAAAGGHISRIAVSPSGYGNALYVSHPNGYTTVYAHLDRFIPEVADYVRQKQYELRKFRVNLYPRPNQFVLEKGQLIGYLGNSGSSFGPHLHFEVRRTADQVPINPFHFGFEIEDNIPPEILGLRMYYLDGEYNVYHTEDITPVEVGTGEYRLNDTLVAGAWRIAFAVRTHDRMDGVNNRNGAYLLDMEVDGTKQFAFKMDAVSFSKSRYINAHIDYAAAADDLGRMHRFFKLPGNALDFYRKGPDAGYIQVFEQKPRQVCIAVSDFSGNSSSLSFQVLRDPDMLKPKPSSGSYCDENNSLTVENEGFEFRVPAGALYAPTYFEYRTSESPEEGWFGPLHSIGSKHIPLHKYSELKLKSAGVPGNLASKAYIARLPEGEDDEVTSLGGTMLNGWIAAATRSCGTFGIRVDTIAPFIEPVVFDADMRNKPYMRFRIGDDIKTSGRASGISYEASVDGNWILMEYDAKNDILTHWFDDRISSGEHLLHIAIRDDRNNISTFERRFIR